MFGGWTTLRDFICSKSFSASPQFDARPAGTSTNGQPARGGNGTHRERDERRFTGTCPARFASHVAHRSPTDPPAQWLGGETPAQKGPPLWPIMHFRVMMGFLRSTHRSPLRGENTGPVGGERAHPPVRARRGGSPSRTIGIWFGRLV